MELMKKKSSTYLLVKLNKADVKYLRDFKKYEHPKHIKEIDKLFSDLITLHVQAVYVMTYGDMLVQDKIVTNKFMNRVTSELNIAVEQYAKTIKKYMDKIYALDMKHRGKTKRKRSPVHQK
jgi:hypothetical protein